MTTLNVFINAAATLPDVRFQVDGFTKSEYFGCETATISALVDGEAVSTIAGLVNLVGFDVTITDETGEPRWWGFVSEVIMQHGGISYGLSLDNMYNAVGVTYSDDMGVRGELDFLRNNESVARFGEKQIRITASNVDLDAATARRDLALADMAKPTGVLSFQRSESKRPRAVLRCQGHGARLDWRYYHTVQGVEESTVSSGGFQAFGEGSDINRVAMQLSPNTPLNFTMLDLALQKEGAPSDSVFAEIRLGGETGTVLATATYPAASIPLGGFKYVRQNLSVPLSGTTIDPWLVISRTGASDSTNYYKVALDSTMSYTTAPLKLRVAAAWVTGGIPKDGNVNFRLLARDRTTNVIKTAIENLSINLYGNALFTGVDVLINSDTYVIPYANGDQRLGQEMERLLQFSKAGNAAIFATVTPQKRITIYGTSPGNAYSVNAAGEVLSPDGRAIPTASCPVGVYMRTLDVFPTLEQTGVLSSASTVIVTRSEYQATYNASGEIVDETYSFIPRGADDPFDDNLTQG